MEKALVILSGGMDSCILLHDLAQQKIERRDVFTVVEGPKFELYAITFNYGQRIVREIECAKEQAKLAKVKEHKIVNMDFFKDVASKSSLTNSALETPKARDDIGNAQPLSYVPFRNLFLLTAAAAWAESNGIERVFYGAVGTDDLSGYWDCTTPFLEKVNNIYSLNRKHTILVDAPYMKWTKDRVLKRGLELGVNLKQTHTCYEGKEEACGECVSCAARLQAFIDNKTIDPIEYSRNIPWDYFKCKEIGSA